MQYIKRDVLRLLDANLNRAVEGVRVLEESARMLFDDSVLTTSLKDIRHELVYIFKQEKKLDRLMIFARDSERDVLRNGETKSEQSRNDVISVVRANAGRAEEAVRSIEEFIKLSFPSLSERFKKIRFRLYDIEKTLVLRIHSQKLVNKERLGLCVIIETGYTGEELDITGITRSVIGEGAGTVMYLDRVSDDRSYLTNAGKMLDACGNDEVTTVLYDRLDCAMVLGADGVHLDTGGIPAAACRSIAGEGFVIGYTVPDEHSPDIDSLNGVDYLIINIISEITSKKQDILSALRKTVSQSPVPVVASGGVALNNIEQILECGVTGIAIKAHCLRLKEIRKFRDLIGTR